jgi:plasmid maintenance system antidote protein VapI
MKAGRSQYATAKALGIRKQRVSQIVARLRQLGELPQERAS